MKNLILRLNGGLEDNMGLCIFSGPKWEDDTLNDINETSILLNTNDMFEKCRISCFDYQKKNKPLQNMFVEVGKMSNG